MRVRPLVVCIGFLLFASPARAALQATTGVALGVDGGVGGEGSVTATGIAQDFPFAARVAVGFYSLDPGNADLARQVFVNGATNGSPEKSGHRWDLRLDARVPIRSGRLKGTWFFMGPRLSLFHGDFNFVDGNEEFFVSTNQVGFGAGLDRDYAINAKLDLTMSAGVDWYADGTFTGHGSSYSPDGTLVDPKENFGYAAADQAIAQPRFAPRFALGLQRPFGR
jgi:hypothetical protein